MIRLCVFDLDGTLINTLEDLANTTDYALQKHGFPPRRLDEYRTFVSDGLPKLIQRSLGDNYTPELGQRLIADFNQYYSLHYKDHSTVYAGIYELLQDLCDLGVQLAVVSNKTDDFLRMIVDDLFPPGTFAMVQGKDERFPLKPDPAAVLHVLDTLGIEPSETLYIGDSSTDILTAHNADIKAVGVSWGFRDAGQLQAAGADYIVYQPAEILPLVLQHYGVPANENDGRNFE